MGKKIDLSGQTFDKLKVLRKDELRRGYYICECECKIVKSIRGSHLTAGMTKSCGCLRTKLSTRSKTSEMINKTFERLTVRAEHPERKNRKIQYICDCSCGKSNIVASGVYLRNGDIKSCGCIKKEMIERMQDSIEKTASDSTNILIQNRKTRADNTSGCTGVYLDKKSGLYRATLRFKNKAYSLGYYKNFDEAVKIRRNAEQLTREAFAEWYEKYKDNFDDAPKSPCRSEPEKIK